MIVEKIKCEACGELRDPSDYTMETCEDDIFCDFCMSEGEDQSDTFFHAMGEKRRATIYVTPYDLKTKKCLAASTVCGFKISTEAEKIRQTVPNTQTISESKHLVLLNVAGSGLAFSDFQFRYE